MPFIYNQEEPLSHLQNSSNILKEGSNNSSHLQTANLNKVKDSPLIISHEVILNTICLSPLGQENNSSNTTHTTPVSKLKRRKKHKLNKKVRIHNLVEVIQVESFKDFNKNNTFHYKKGCPCNIF